MNRITIAQLEAFFWVASLGSVDKAARQLSLSQPTVSLRLKGLEEAVGARLFDRIGRGLKPSLEGQALLPRARRVLETVEDIGRHAAPGPVGGRVRVGLAEGFALVCLGPVLERLQALHPDLKPELVIATSAALEPELRAHRLDLGFLVNPGAPEDFTLIPLGTQETTWMGPRQWQLPDVVRPRDLAHLPVLSNQPGSIGYRQVQSWFASAGITPTRLITCSSVAMLAHLVASGAGVSIMPKKLAEVGGLAEGLAVLRAFPAVEDVPIFATYHVDRQTPAITAVIDVFHRVLSGMDYLRGDAAG